MTTTRIAVHSSFDAVRIASVAAWVALAFFTIFSVGLPLLGHGVFLGTDLLGIAAPWKSSLEIQPDLSNVWLGDTIDTVTPQVALIMDGLRQGTLAQWNPFQSGGTELGALPNSGAFSPLSLPWLVLPYSYAPGAVKVLEIAVIAVGMSLLLRRFGLPSGAWALASLVFASSGFMITWTNWPQTRVAAFIPLLFWALERICADRRPKDAVALGLVVAAMLLGGFPAVTGYALYAGAAYMLFRTVVLHKSFAIVVRAAAVAGGGVVLGALLSAWQMIPFALNAIGVIDFDVRAQNSEMHLGLDALATALVPGIIGGPDDPSYWGESGNPIERFSYVGVGVLVLIGSALVFRRRRATAGSVVVFSFVALACCIVLIYLGGPLLALSQEFPIFSNNPVARLRVLVGFFAAVIAAFAFADVIQGSRGQEMVEGSMASRTALTVPVAAAWASITVCAFGAVWVVRQTLYLAPAERIDQVRTETIVMFALGIFALLLVVLARVGNRAFMRTGAALLIPVVVAAPATIVAESWWHKSSDESFYPMTETHAFLAENLGGSRYSPVGQVMLPGTNSFYHLRSLGGHSFHTQEWKDLIDELGPENFLSPTYSTISGEGLNDMIGSPILDRLAVRYIVLDPGAQLPGSHSSEDETTRPVLLSAGEPVSSANYTGPVRGISFSLPAGLDPGDQGVVVDVDLVDATDDRVIASTSTWSRARGGENNVALAGDKLPDGAEWYVRLTVQDVDATVAVRDSGELAINVTVPDDDGISVVHTGDATVLERGSALERVRWASSAVVIPDASERLEALSSRDTGRDTVVLESPDEAASDPTDTAGKVTGFVEEETGKLDEVRARVEASAPGWVVVEDAVRSDGWTATVDGEPAEILDAEHAGGAVYVEAGAHLVVLSYTAPGLRWGVLVTLTTAVLVGGACLVSFVVRRRGAS